MRKIVLSLVVLVTLGVAGGEIKEMEVVSEPFAADNGKVSGQIRLFGISRERWI